MTLQLTNQTKVSIVAAVCLLALIITLKNILNVPAEILSRDVILYIIIYSIWGILYPSPIEASRKPGWDKPLYWSLLIILITLTIIGVYAL